MIMKRIFAFLTFSILIIHSSLGQSTYSNLSLQQVLDSADAMNDISNQPIVKELLTEIESRIDKGTPEKLVLSYYLTAGIYNFNDGHIPAAKKYYDKALKLALRLNDSNHIGISYSHIASIETMSGLPKVSIEYYQKALDYYQLTGDETYYGLLLNMAVAYTRNNESQKALTNLIKAKKYFTTKKDYAKVAIIENNIGEIYRANIHDYSKAIIHYRRAAQANIKVNNELGLAQNYHNISSSFLDQNLPDSAIYYTKKSVAIKERLGGEGAMASANYLLASTYSKSGYYDEALKYYSLSLEQCEKYGLVDGIFHNTLDIGEIYFKTGKFDQSAEMLKKCASMAEESGQLPMLESVYTGLYELHRAQGKFKNALTYLEKKQSIVDTIRNNKEKQHLSELRTQYEADLSEAENMVLKEKEIAQHQKLESQQNLLYISLASIALLLIAGIWLVKTLGQRNRAFAREKESNSALAEQYQKLKKSERDLAESNNLKNKILSVLGHDLRTPLSSISSLLSTMSAVEITREELQDLLGYLKKDVDISLTTLHEILAWARLQMNEITKLIQNLDAKSLIDEVLSIYEPNIRAKVLTVKLEIDPEAELWADHNQMRSICGNLLSNAIKFTPAKGTLTIGVTDNSEFTEITFCDTGLGIPENVLENLNNRTGLISNQGTSGESGTGIGLRIVTDFVDAHKGVIHFKNNPDIGTTVIVHIPKSGTSKRKTA